jgi:ketosteroid isomerase-like protein
VVDAQRQALLKHAYRLFNDRQIDALFALMTDDVEWPDVANGAVLHGKDEIRPYWEGQFRVADPRVVPIDFIQAGDDVVAVVDQRVLDFNGQTLAGPTVVFHRYTFAGDLVRRMVVFVDREAAKQADHEPSP